MPERKFVFERQEINYEGLFNLYEFFFMIDQWFKKKGYDKRERRNNEYVSEAGKDIEIWLEPWKKVTDYLKLVVKIEMHFSNLKEVIVEKDGAKIKLNKGKAKIVFDGWIETDYEGSWQARPDFFFLRTVFDKFVYKVYMDKYEKLLKDDCYQVYNETKTFLNIHRYM